MAAAGEETDTPASQPDQKTTRGGGGDVVGDENRNHLKEDKSEETPKEGQINRDIHLRGEEENKKQDDGEEKDTQDGVRVEEENQETTSGESPNNKEEEDKSHVSCMKAFFRIFSLLLLVKEMLSVLQGSTWQS